VEGHYRETSASYWSQCKAHFYINKVSSIELLTVFPQRTFLYRVGEGYHTTYRLFVNGLFQTIFKLFNEQNFLTVL